MTQPVTQPGQETEQYTYTLSFEDNFDGVRALSDTFSLVDMSDALHRTGNQGQDADGNITSGSVRGKRWSFWYDGYADQTMYVQDSALYFGLVLTNEADPTRISFTVHGETYHPQNHRAYAAFAVTWDRVWSNENNRQETDPNSPNLTWGPNTFIEFEFDGSGMNTPGARWSSYFLPAYEFDSNSYDEDGTLGVEIDWPEVEAGGSADGLSHDDNLQCKVLAGLNGSTPGGNVEAAGIIPGFNFRDGVHVYALLWLKNLLVWYVDGIEVIRETDPRRIPLVALYLVFSREGNTGAKEVADNPGDLVAQPPKIPVDVGLFVTNFWEFKDRANADRSRINYLRSWDVTGDLPEPGRGVGDGVSGIRPVLTSDAPSGSSHTFTWSGNGRAVTDWRLLVGTTRGGNEIYSSGTISGTSAVVNNLPTDGSNINIRLWFRNGDTDPWDFQDVGYPDLSDYRRGTDGRVRVTTVEDTPSTPPTVGGSPYLGRGGTGTPIDDPDDGGGGESVTSPLNPNIVIDFSPRITNGMPELHAAVTGVNGYDTTGRIPTWSADPDVLEFEPADSQTPRVVIKESFDSSVIVNVTCTFPE